MHYHYATKFRPVTPFSFHRFRFVSDLAYVATFRNYAHEFLRMEQNRVQDNRVNEFFGRGNNAKFLTCTAPIEDIKFPDNLGGLPEVIFTGRANVGKSTLLNAIMNRKDLAHTGQRPGFTNCLNYYGVGGKTNRFVLVDSPGYGSRGRPEWGRMFEKYIAERKELRRVYLVVNIKHPLAPTDKQMLSYLCSAAVTPEGRQRFGIQVVLTKADEFKDEALLKTFCTKMHQTLEDVAPMAVASIPILTTALSEKKLGVKRVRWDIATACGLLQGTELATPASPHSST